MTVEELIRRVIVRLGNINVPVKDMAAIGTPIATCICELNACLNAKVGTPAKDEAENGGDGNGTESGEPGPADDGQ